MKRLRRISRVAPGLVLGIALALTTPALAAPEGADAIRLLDPRTGTTAVLGRGAPVMHVAFFATWCQTCLDELERLSELEDRWRGEGYRLVLVAVPSRQNAERLAAFAEERTLPGRLAFDEAGTLTALLSADRLPTHVLLDSTGAEIARAETADQIAAALERRFGDGSRKKK